MCNSSWTVSDSHGENGDIPGIDNFGPDTELGSQRAEAFVRAFLKQSLPQWSQQDCESHLQLTAVVLEYFTRQKPKQQKKSKGLSARQRRDMRLFDISPEQQSHEIQVSLLCGVTGILLPETKHVFNVITKEDHLKEVLGFEGSTYWEGVIDEGEVHRGIAWSMTFVFLLDGRAQEDLEEDGEQREAIIANAELFPGTVAQALVEVEKASVLMDVDPLIFMELCVEGTKEMLVQA
ncbi:hypothetical protein STEG23_027529 [Scotinomys teguina]